MFTRVVFPLPFFPLTKHRVPLYKLRSRDSIHNRLSPEYEWLICSAFTRSFPLCRLESDKSIFSSAYICCSLRSFFSRSSFSWISWLWTSFNRAPVCSPLFRAVLRAMRGSSFLFFSPWLFRLSCFSFSFWIFLRAKRNMRSSVSMSSFSASISNVFCSL